MLGDTSGYPYVYYTASRARYLSGGGGGGGAKLHTTVPDANIPKGGSITLSAPICQGGTAGKPLYGENDSGNSYIKSGSRATNGKGGADCPAQLTIKNSSGTIVYALQAYAGQGGTVENIDTTLGLSYTDTTAQGSNTCRVYSGSWSNIACSAAGKAGGASSYARTTSSITPGGVGGNGADNNTTGKGGQGGSVTAAGVTSAGVSGNAGYARFYYDSIISLPVSGGGGGSSGSITNLVIPQSVIDANIGGTIETFSGAGGAFGAARANGSNGNYSYVIVRAKSTNNIVWGVRVLGGSGGAAATTTAGGSGGNGGTCQSWNGSDWASYPCTSNGLKGGTGAKSATGSAVAGGSSVGSGYGASGAGASSISTNGASGTGGIAQITYDRYLQAAAGGGGGGGAYAQIKGIKVIPLKTYEIRIGKGGNAGNIGLKGQNGGMSYVKFEGTTHYATGGEGGNPGTAQSTSTAVSHGTGGTYGKITTSTTGITFKNGTQGSNGTSSGFNSSGGNGGTSGADTKGACGGLFINATICQNNSINGQTLTFKLPRNINKTPTMGSAGAGGAGGGWSSSNYNQTGSGSKGLDGYVYIWWQTFK